ncbi:MAG: hypothetical protein ACRDRQ_20380 [Pseudonocardiaceae bacterium]
MTTRPTTWIYPALFTAEADEIRVSFPDFPEALTSGRDAEKALTNASDALDEVVSAYLLNKRTLPAPRPSKSFEKAIPLSPLIAARAHLAAIMIEQRITNADLAGRLGLTEGAVRRLRNPAIGAKLDTVLAALRMLGFSAALSIGEIE